MAKITNGFLCGVTQSQNVPMSLSFILMREWMRERQNEIDCGWARISTFVLYRDSIVYPKLHYLSNLKGTFSSLSSLKKYFYHLSSSSTAYHLGHLDFHLYPTFRRTARASVFMPGAKPG